MIEILLIIVLAFIQSLFGVGILLFGTPILLLANYEFFEVLRILVLPSFAVSLVTLVASRQHVSFDRRLLLLPPFVFTGLFLSQKISGDVLVVLSGILILVAGISLEVIEEKRETGSHKHIKATPTIFYPILAVIHGLTNLGGALLVAWMSSRYSSKEKIRGLTALIYAILAAAQVGTLALGYDTVMFTWNTVLLCACALGAFLITNLVFAKIDPRQYRHYCFRFIIITGVAVIVKGVFT